MTSIAARAGPVRLLFLVACLAIASPIAKAQPDSAPTVAPLHVDSAEFNLSVAPRFQFAIVTPTLLRFSAFQVGGQVYLHVWAISRVDSLDARIRRAARYQALRPGIFTPLIEPPNRELSITARFDQSLRNFKPERTLSYNRRLT